MTRTATPLYISDLSAFARALSRQLPDGPGHQTLLNALAKAGGFRNLSHLQAQRPAEPPRMGPDDAKAVAAALRLFRDGQLRQWPARTRIQRLCLWVLWSRLPARTDFSEREISAELDGMTLFQDAAQLRRAMVEFGLVARTKDGSRYTRIEGPPPPAARAVIDGAFSG